MNFISNSIKINVYIQGITDSDFGETFRGYLEEMERCTCPIEGLTLCKTCGKYWNYIKNHLTDMKCPYNDCPLW